MDRWHEFSPCRTQDSVEHESAPTRLVEHAGAGRHSVGCQRNSGRMRTLRSREYTSVPRGSILSSNSSNTFRIDINYHRTRYPCVFRYKLNYHHSPHTKPTQSRPAQPFLSSFDCIDHHEVDFASACEGYHDRPRGLPFAARDEVDGGERSLQGFQLLRQGSSQSGVSRFGSQVPKLGEPFTCELNRQSYRTLPEPRQLRVRQVKVNRGQLCGLALWPSTPVSPCTHAQAQS